MNLRCHDVYGLVLVHGHDTVLCEGICKVSTDNLCSVHADDGVNDRCCNILCSHGFGSSESHLSSAFDGCHIDVSVDVGMVSCKMSVNYLDVQCIIIRRCDLGCHVFHSLNSPFLLLCCL